LTGDRVHKADRAPEGKYSNSIKEAEEACATAESLARQLLTLSPTGGRRWMTRVAARKKGTPFAAAIMDLTPPRQTGFPLTTGSQFSSLRRLPIPLPPRWWPGFVPRAARR
jgi:hypothetical protein